MRMWWPWSCSRIRSCRIEVVALRQGRALLEIKSNDATTVSQLTYGATICSGLGFGMAPVSTGVSLEGLVGVPMNWPSLWGTVPAGAMGASAEEEVARPITVPPPLSFCNQSPAFQEHRSITNDEVHYQHLQTLLKHNLANHLTHVGLAASPIRPP